MSSGKRALRRRAQKGSPTTAAWIAAMDAIDRAILFFAISWLPYGRGPEDEVLINFGITPDRYATRLISVIDRYEQHLNPGTVDRLRQVHA